MSVSYAHGSPSASSPSANASGSSNQQRRRASTSGSSHSTGSTSKTPTRATATNNPFASPTEGRETPISPTASTISAGGSPRSFYSAAQASTSEGTCFNPFHYRSYPQTSAVFGEDGTENDIGDLTITHHGSATSQRTIAQDRKGKGPQTSGDSDTTFARTYDSITDEEVDEYDDLESQRIAETLKGWAEKDKLRRAKTRSRGTTPSKSQAGSSGPGERGSSFTQLVRNMSTARNSMATSRPGHSRKGSRRLQSLDSRDEDVFSDAARVPHQEELELQPQRQRQRPAPIDENPSILSPLAMPTSATSAQFPERVQRAARTGSRFIEDLEDQEMRGMLPGQPQTYAELGSNPSTPFGSPVKANPLSPGPTPKRSALARLSAIRTSSVVSLESNDTASPRHHKGTAYVGDAHSLESPTYAVPRQYYGGSTDGHGVHLVESARKSGEYGQMNGIEDEYDDPDSRRRIGWLEYILCCGCFSSHVRLDDIHDEQAGRTFPE